MCPLFISEMCSYYVKLKYSNNGFVSYKLAAFYFTGCELIELELCGLLVDYCDVYQLVWTLILTDPHNCRGSTWWEQWCNAILATFLLHFSKSAVDENLYIGWHEISGYFPFWVNYSFKIPVGCQELSKWVYGQNGWPQFILSLEILITIYNLFTVSRLKGQ